MSAAAGSPPAPTAGKSDSPTVSATGLVTGNKYAICVRDSYLNHLEAEFDLKAGDIDDEGVRRLKRRGKKRKQTTPDGWVVELQDHLKKFVIGDVGESDGIFGRKGVLKAVQAFQAAALTKHRWQGKELKEVQITYKGKIDGLVDRDVKEEITRWLGNGYTAYYPKLTASVGRRKNKKGKVTEGANRKPDVLLVQDRLRELGYVAALPSSMKITDGVCDDGTVMAIKLFQAQAYDIDEHVKTKRGRCVPLPGGLIQKGKEDEKRLLGSNPPRYKEVAKGSIKPIQAGIKKRKDEATGDEKKIWDKLEEVWNRVSPHFPEGTNMSSGYRSDARQREMLRESYNETYKADLIKKFGKDEWEKYKKMQGVDDVKAEPEMRSMLAKVGFQIALPGTSSHRSGKAIDVSDNAGNVYDAQQIRALLWAHVMLDEKLVAKILPETAKNGKVVHWEFQ